MNETTKIRKTALQPFYFSAFEIVEGSNDFSANMMDDFVVFNHLCHPFGMTAGIVINAAVFVDGRFDAFGQIKDVTRQVTALAGCSDGTTS